jgi:hypothetical protein
MAYTGTAALAIAELREFAGFSPCEQRYIKRSLDVGLGRQDAFKLWARDAAESASIRTQYVMYQELKALRGAAPAEGGLDAIENFMGKLVRLTAFDLSQEKLTGFSPYRFLYERLLGADARPWLPSALRGGGPAADPAGTPQEALAIHQRSGGHGFGLVHPRTGLLSRVGGQGSGLNGQPKAHQG